MATQAAMRHDQRTAAFEAKFQEEQAERERVANELAARRVRLLLAIGFGMLQSLQDKDPSGGFDLADRFITAMDKQGYKPKDLVG